MKLELRNDHETLINARLLGFRRLSHGPVALAAAGILAFAIAPLALAGPPATSPDAFTLVTFDANPFDGADPVVLRTQACVAAISKSDLPRARRACSDAIDAAHSNRLHPLEATFAIEGSRRDLAITYNNRAVMHQLAGEFDAARSDIARAAGLAPHDQGIERTRARIDGANGVANRVVAQAAL